MKLPYQKLEFILYWLLKRPEYIFKIAPSKNTFSKIVSSKNINFISSIYSSSESPESSELSFLTTIFSIYVHSFRETCGK